MLLYSGLTIIYLKSILEKYKFFTIDTRPELIRQQIQDENIFANPLKFNTKLLYNGNKHWIIATSRSFFKIKAIWFYSYVHFIIGISEDKNGMHLDW